MYHKISINTQSASEWVASSLKYKCMSTSKKRKKKLGSYILIWCTNSPTTNFFMIITTKLVEESPVFLKEDFHPFQFQSLCSTNIFSQMLKYLSYLTCIFTKSQSWSLHFSFRNALFFPNECPVGPWVQTFFFLKSGTVVPKLWRRLM